jgi:hypothetical protein
MRHYDTKIIATDLSGSVHLRREPALIHDSSVMGALSAARADALCNVARLRLLARALRECL